MYRTAKEREVLTGQKLKNTLKLAYECSPFYRRVFEDRGLKPEDIKSSAELLEKLPIVDKNDLIKSIPPTGNFDFFSAREQTNIIMYTSGTTGRPKVIASSDDDRKCYKKDFLEAYKIMNLPKNAVVLDVLPFGINASGPMTVEGFREMGVQVITVGVAPFPPKEALIKTHNPNVIIGLTSYVERIALDLQSKGIDTTQLGIKKIMLGGESSTKEKRDKISRLYNADVYDLYGTTEFGNVGIECIKKNGIHIMDHNILLKIIDPKTKKEVEDGKTGHVILTKLINKNEKPGNILINYFIGDESSIISRERCECGKPYMRIASPRRADGAVFVSGAKIDYHDLEAIISSPENSRILTGEFEIVVSNPDGKYNLLCRVEPKKGVDIPIGYTKQIEKALMEINFPLANEVSGKRVDFEVRLVNENELECKKPGKPKRIIDRRKE